MEGLEQWLRYVYGLLCVANVLTPLDDDLFPLHNPGDLMPWHRVEGWPTGSKGLAGKRAFVDHMPGSGQTLLLWVEFSGALVAYSVPDGELVYRGVVPKSYSYTALYLANAP